MAEKREDRPVEHEADLSPVTVKLDGGREDDDDGDDSDEGSSEGQAPVAAAPRPGVQQQQGQPSGMRQSRPGGAPGRPSKFGNRMKALQQGHEGTSRELAELKQTIAELRGAITAYQSQGGQGGGQAQASPQEQQLTTVNDQLQNLVNLSANPDLSPEDRRQLGQQFTKLDNQRKQIESAMLREELKRDILKEVQQNQPNPEVAHYSASLAQEFPEMVGNARATSIAKAYYADLVNENGGNESLGLMREACAWACQSLNLGRSGGGSRMGRAAYAGAAGGNQRQESNGSDPNSIHFDSSALRVMQGSGMSPNQVAEQMARMRRGEV